MISITLSRRGPSSSPRACKRSARAEGERRAADTTGFVRRTAAVVAITPTLFQFGHALAGDQGKFVGGQPVRMPLGGNRELARLAQPARDATGDGGHRIGTLREYLVQAS